MYGEADVQIHAFLISASVGGERPTSRPGQLTTGETAPSTHWIGGWVGPRTGLDDVERKKSYPYWNSNSDPLVVNPLASRIITLIRPMAKSLFKDHFRSTC
jgi:hypothetical protein